MELILKYQNAQNTLKNLYETLTNKYPIDFILNGHEHDKQLIVTKNKTKQIITGTGSVIRFFPERNKTVGLRHRSSVVLCTIRGITLLACCCTTITVTK